MIPLTHREHDILARIVRGLGMKEIAAEFGTSVQTVSKQCRKLLIKFGVQSNIDLVRRILRAETTPPMINA